MGIKQTVKIGFVIIFICILSMALSNTISLHKVEENALYKNHITNLIKIQENMNQLIFDTLLITQSKELKKIKNSFIQKEEQFEQLKEDYFLNDKDNLIDYFIVDIQKNRVIKAYLLDIYENEKVLETLFDTIYEVQTKRLQIKKVFENIYPLENSLRKTIQKSIWDSKNIQLIKEFSDLKYYSKEALYQHKNQEYLDKWYKKAEALAVLIPSSSMKKYLIVIQDLSRLVIHANTLDIKEKTVLKNIQDISASNKALIDLIERSSQQIQTSFITTNNYVIFSIIVVAIVLILITAVIVSKNIGLSVDEIEYKVKEATQEIKGLNKEIEETQREVVFTMGAIGESRSKETGNHVKRVAQYSKVLALYYGLEREEAEMLKQASPMHDIGKVAIPDAILNKPGRFDEHERKIMDTHAKLGYEMLKHSSRPLLKCAAIVALEHHEKWDGTGYPRGLKDEEIHIYGRITALADVFDALGSDRVYKKAWDDERIFNLFKEERGKHFDPTLIDIFFEHLEEFLAIRKQFQDV